ncbi:MAG TPA: DUF1501 domain-containing protein [Thermoanaerobaculia bacterium]|nr:DUF1501 domain-containing protein [Thermoanaerobaculia bacterium]HQR66935.1 DUF1501 domain-containing protein [Thermoanaerobaculia bacterium]
MRTRRDFARDLGCGLGATALLSTIERFSRLEAAAATATDYKALVCVFLYGGNDANNMIIPYDDYASYAAVRGTTLNIPKASLLQVSAPSQGAAFGLHPTLTDFQTLYGAGKLAVLANVGTLAAPTTRSQFLAGAERPDSLFSHSDQQAQWQCSIMKTQDRLSQTGWGGRTADALAGLNGTSFPMVISTSGVPVFTAGVTSRPLVPGATLQGFPNGNAVATARLAAFRKLLTLESGQTLVGAASTVTSAAIDNTAVLNAALAKGAALKTTFPGTSIGRQLQQVAGILSIRNDLKINRQIFFVSLGGFDTHTDEINSHQTLFTQLNAAVKAFYDATVELGVADGVTTFTLSDFGRTFQPASGGGSDHAWGSHHFILGGSVKGGDFYGTFPNLALKGPDDSSSEGRWIPTTSVDQYGATLAQWFGLSAASVSSVFPNIGRFASNHLGFLP